MAVTVSAVRIIAGSRKGSTIFAPKGRDTRPTSDRAREAAFNLIGPVDGVRVLDLSDPSRPVEIAHFDTIPGPGPAYGYSFFEGAVGIDLDPGSGRIYVADSHRGLLVLQLDR